MPCYDPQREEAIADTFGEVAALNAMLCAIFRAYAGNLQKFLDGIDYAQCGVRREHFESWWRAHQIRDQERELREHTLEWVKVPGGWEAMGLNIEGKRVLYALRKTPPCNHALSLTLGELQVPLGVFNTAGTGKRAAQLHYDSLVREVLKTLEELRLR